jgi:hypothetical protein
LAIIEIAGPSRWGSQKCGDFGTRRSGSAKGAESPFLRSKLSRRRPENHGLSVGSIHGEPVLAILLRC